MIPNVNVEIHRTDYYMPHQNHQNAHIFYNDSLVKQMKIYVLLLWRKRKIDKKDGAVFFPYVNGSNARKLNPKSIA